MAQGPDNNQEENEVIERQSPSRWLNPFTWVASWQCTSMAALAQAERRILASVWNQLEQQFVTISNGTNKIRTIALNTDAMNIPLVLVHGMGAGVGLWILNLEAISRNRPVYAFDLLGFGRSSRPKFSSDPLLAELEFVESVEEWRKGVKLEKFILLGHSLGGFIATSYAIRYPDRVRHLILADPWGFPEKPSPTEFRVPVPLWIKAIAMMLQPFNPLAALRAAGPWGPGLVARFRPDITQKFEHLFDDDTVPQYIFHCNAQTPSGEKAFRHMTIPFGWAKYPMIKRVTELPRSLPMTVIYGSRSWVDSGIGYEIKYLRNESYVDVQVIKGAGHHVYADKAYQFNNAVIRICQIVENRMDFGQPFVPTGRRRTRISESISPAESAALQKDSRRHHSESMPTFSKIQVDTDDWERAYRAPTVEDRQTQDDNDGGDDNDVAGGSGGGGGNERAGHTSSKVAFSVGSESIQEEEN